MAADLTKTTTLVNGDVFDPQVVSDMINAKVTKKAVMTGYIKVDNTLEGVAGSKVTMPSLSRQLVRLQHSLQLHRCSPTLELLP